MVTVLTYCRVDDYDFWRPRYDQAFDAIAQIRSAQVWRDQDDPNLVVIAETFDSREIAEPIVASQEVHDAMVADGVDMESVRIHYLDDAGSLSR